MYFKHLELFGLQTYRMCYVYIVHAVFLGGSVAFEQIAETMVYDEVKIQKLSQKHHSPLRVT